jgi:hypothetical protein
LKPWIFYWMNLMRMTLMLFHLMSLETDNKY